MVLAPYSLAWHEGLAISFETSAAEGEGVRAINDLRCAGNRWRGVQMEEARAHTV